MLSARSVDFHVMLSSYLLTQAKDSQIQAFLELLAGLRRCQAENTTAPELKQLEHLQLRSRMPSAIKPCRGSR